MVHSIPVDRWIWYLNTALQLALIARLLLSGLASRYRWFVGYLAAMMVQAAVLAWFRTDSLQFYYLWLATEPLIWAFYFLVVLELYALVLNEYDGLATAGRWALKGSLFLSVALALVVLMVGPSGPGEQHWMMKLIVTMQKTVGATLCLFLLGITGFLVYFPVPLRRNLIVYCVLFFAYFLSLASGMWVREAMGPEKMEVVNLVLLLVYSGCLLGWLALLSPAGERAKSVARQPLAGVDEKHLLDQLNALNSALLKSMKK